MDDTYILAQIDLLKHHNFQQRHTIHFQAYNDTLQLIKTLAETHE